MLVVVVDIVGLVFCVYFVDLNEYVDVGVV